LSFPDGTVPDKPVLLYFFKNLFRSHLTNLIAVCLKGDLTGLQQLMQYQILKIELNVEQK